MTSIIHTLEKHLTDKTISTYFCDEGLITYSNTNYDDELAVHGFFLKPEFQRKGIFINFINNIVHNYPKINTIRIIQPNMLLCTILQTQPFNNRYFVNTFIGELIWRRSSDCYDSDESLLIANKLLPARKILTTISIREFIAYIYNNDLVKYM